MAEKRGNKEVTYTREVFEIILQDEKGCPNLKNYKSDKGGYFETDEIRRKRTEKIVIYKTNADFKEGKEDYTCEVCAVACSGIDNFKLHIEGKKHRKNLNKLNILKAMKTFPRTVYIPMSIKHEQKCKECVQVSNEKAKQEVLSLKIQMTRLEDPARSEDASCGKSSFDYCEVCKKYFASQRAYCHHLEKDEHFKRDQNRQALMKNIANSSENCSMLSCGICHKEFTGLVPYKQHLLSSSHRKKDEPIRDLNEFVRLKQSSGISCEEYGIKFSGIVPLYDHLKGASHRRLIRKKQLSVKLEKEHPEVLKNALPRIWDEDVKEFNPITFSKNKNAKGDCHGERQRELSKNDYHTEKLNEVLNRLDFKEENLFQLSDSDDSSDDVLLEI